MSGKKTVGRPRIAENQLSDWLNRQGLSREQFSAQLGVSRVYVDKLCRGAKSPGLVLAVKISRLTEGRVPASYWVKA